MTSLTPGQNVPWPDRRVTAYLEHPSADLAALLLGPDYRVRGHADLVWRDAPSHGGVDWLAGQVPGITVDLPAVDAGVDRILCVASQQTAFAGTTPVVRLLATDGTVVADFTADGLAREQAVVLCEVYRRNGSWKVRAVGQGYDGGLAQAASAHGLTLSAVHPQPADPVMTDPSGGATTAPGAATGVGFDGLVEQMRMILDDASRTTASLQSTMQWAEAALERDLEQIVADPSLRIGPRGDAARAEAQRRHDSLVNQARANHARDIAQLMAEIEGLETGLPAPLARWESSAWRGWQPTQEFIFGFRLGELSLPEAPQFRMPMVSMLPLNRPIWIDPEAGGDQAATRMLHVLGARLLAAMAPARTMVTVIDIGGRRGTFGFPETLLAEAPVTDSGTASRVLSDLVTHLDLITMAVQSGTLDALDERQHRDRLLLVADFPTGLDESGLRCVHRLINDGPRFGVHVAVSGTHSEALGIPLLELLHEQFLRIPTAPGGDLVDAFGGVGWTFLPDYGPEDPTLLPGVLDALTRSRARAR